MASQEIRVTNWFAVCCLVLLPIVHSQYCRKLNRLELRILSEEMGAPFSWLSDTRFLENRFNSSQAPQSGDVVIINTTDKKMRLIHDSCSKGGYVDSLSPEHEIAANSTSFFGIESKDRSSEVECIFRYYIVNQDNSPPGALFLKAYNSAAGHIAYTADAFEVKVDSVWSEEKNNQARFIIKPISE